MNINNRYTVNPLYNGSQEYDTEDEKSSSGKTTIIYQGGDGLTSELKEKLNSIEKGALVNQDAFSYVKLSDGAISQTIDARLPKDTVNLTVSGKGGIRTELTTIYEIDNLQIASTSELNKGVYLFNYSRLETIVPPPEESPSGTEPTTVVTWPLTMKYVSGPTLTKSDFTHMLLFSKGELQWEFAKDKLTITEIESIVDTISISQLNFYFDQVRLINVTTVADKIITTVVCLFDKVLVYKFNTILISSQTDDLWKLDKDGNLYTDRNLYSTKEVSAYGFGTGGGTGGAGALYECADVLRDGDKVQGAVNGALLSYNGSHWRAIPQSSVTPDLSGYVKTEQIGATSGIAPLDSNRLIPSTYLPSYVDDVVEVSTFASLPITGQSGKIYVTLDTNLTYRWSGSNYVEISKSLALGYTNSTAFPGDEGLANTNSITALRVLLDMFEWDKTDPNNWRIKAKKDLYSIGEVSAYGMGISELPTGAQYMYELKDVLFTSLTNGQLLKYNGTKWVNVNSNEVGLNEQQLGIYLTSNNYAKKSDIPSLTGYATESWVTQLNFAKQSITITAGDGLIGGGNLSANRSISLSSVGIAGSYSKVTTDLYGRVVNGTLANISDIVNLTQSLASKLNVSDFEKWFTIKYNTDGTIKNILANFDFYSVGEVSAYGVGLGEVPGGALYLHELKDVTITDVLNNQLLSYNNTLNKWVNVNKPTYSYSEITGTPPAIDLSNYVTLNTAQTITAIKEFVGYIQTTNDVAGWSYNRLINSNYFWDIACNRGNDKKRLEFRLNGTEQKVTIDDGLNIVANSFVKHGGTSSQFLKADGGIDSNTYVTINHNHSYLLTEDYRNRNPLDFSNKTFYPFFLAGSKLGLSSYFDAMYLNTYSDNSGGKTNLIALSKQNGKMYRMMVDQGAATWNGTLVEMLDTANWQSIIDGRYLLLTGGTMSANIMFNADNIGLGWVGESYNALHKSGDNYIFGSAARGLVLRNYNSDLIHSKAGTNYYVLDTSNWAGYIDGRYLPLSGGIMTGFIRMPDNVAIQNSGGSGILFYDGTSTQIGTPSSVTNVRNNLTVKGNIKGGHLAWRPEIGSSSITNEVVFGMALAGGSFNAYVRLGMDKLEYFNGSSKTIWHSGNDGAGSGLDADLLDGKQLSEVLNSNITPLGTIQSGTVLECKNTLVNLFNSKASHGIGTNVTIGTSFIDQWSSDTSTYYPSSVYSMIKIGGGYTDMQYGQFLLSSYNITKLGVVGRSSNSWSGIKWLAFTTDNVASATKLQTSRSIYGQPFDGTNNVSGKAFVDQRMGGVATVSLAIGDTDTGFDWVSDGAFKIKANAIDIATINTDGIAAYKRIYTDAYIQAGQYVTGSRFFTGYDSGATQSMSCANWFRSNGNTGWINDTHGGGIYMADSNYVRVYNGKAFYVNNNTYSSINTEGGFYSSKANSMSWNWVNLLEPSNAILNCPNQSVGASSTKNMIGWSDQILNVGYHTRYSISSNRSTSGFGEMVLAIGNSDNGTSGNMLRLGGSGSASWSGSLLVGPEDGRYILIGLAKLQYDAANKAIKVIMQDGTPASIYATGDVASYAMSGTGILNQSYTFGNKLFVDSLRSATVDTQPLISLAIGDVDTGFNWLSEGKINIVANNVNVAYWNSTELLVYKNFFNMGATYLTGSVGIGTTTVPLKLTVSGNIIASGTITANTSTSDRRLKCNIENFKAENIIKSLMPKTYNWNDLAKSRADVFNTDNMLYGLIYQDVKDNLYVSEYALDNMFGDGYGMIAYDRFIPILLQGEIELYDEVSQLKARVKLLEDKLKIVEQR